jgi:hypothetical protein
VSASILTSTKKALGIDVAYTAFDVDILMHINSVFSTLNQLGIGPEAGFMIENSTPTWDAFLEDDPRMNSVKTYMYLKVRMVFDPPNTSFVLAALKEQILELEWRLNAYRESTQWTPPVTSDIPEHGNVVLDGGEP